MDEADRMLDFGFEPEVRAILSATPSSEWEGWNRIDPKP